MMNRAEAKIAVRDQILFNLLNLAIGEGTGHAYLEAVREGDAQLDAALRDASSSVSTLAQSVVQPQPAEAPVVD